MEMTKSKDKPDPGDVHTADVAAAFADFAGISCDAARKRLERLARDGVITPRAYELRTGGRPSQVWNLDDALTALGNLVANERIDVTRLRVALNAAGERAELLRKELEYATVVAGERADDIARLRAELARL